MVSKTHQRSGTPGDSGALVALGSLGTGVSFDSGTLELMDSYWLLWSNGVPSLWRLRRLSSGAVGTRGTLCGLCVSRL